MNKNTNIKTIKLIQQIGSDIDWNTKENKLLLEAFVALESTDEVKRFLRDLMTPQEINEFAGRLEAASLLSRDMLYNFITERTGLSSATIARISKFLKGPLGGYRLVLSRLSNSSSHHNNPKLGKGLSLMRN